MFRFAVVLFLLVAGCSRGSSVWDEYNTALQISSEEERVMDWLQKELETEARINSSDQSQLKTIETKLESQKKRWQRALSHQYEIEKRLPQMPR